MRVLHVISGINPRNGGTATAVAALARAQVVAGLDVTIFSTFTGSRDGTGELLRQRGVAVTEIGPTSPPLQTHGDLAPRLQGQIEAADVVHIHALWEEVHHRAARIALRLRRPYIVTPHGMLDPWSLRQSRWRKKLYFAWRLRANLNGAALLHYTSDTERALAARLGLRAPSIVEPNGVDLSEFVDRPQRGAFRAANGIPADRLIVAFLGRLHPKKGLDLLVPAFGHAAPKDATLVIAGPDADEYAAVVRELARRHGVADRLLFTGMLKGRERLEVLVDADLFALTSYQENFGIAVVEALACGCPVVISDQVNIHEEISRAGVGGVARMRPDSVEAELTRWLNDPALRRDAASRGPSFARERYDWDQIARRWLGHYAEICRR